MKLKLLRNVQFAKVFHHGALCSSVNEIWRYNKLWFIKKLYFNPLYAK